MGAVNALLFDGLVFVVPLLAEIGVCARDNGVVG